MMNNIDFEDEDDRDEATPRKPWYAERCALCGKQSSALNESGMNATFATICNRCLPAIAGKSPEAVKMAAVLIDASLGKNIVLDGYSLGYLDVLDEVRRDFPLAFMFSKAVERDALGIIHKTYQTADGMFFVWEEDDWFLSDYPGDDDRLLERLEQIKREAAKQAITRDPAEWSLFFTSTPEAFRALLAELFERRITWWRVTVERYNPANPGTPGRGSAIFAFPPGAKTPPDYEFCDWFRGLWMVRLSSECTSGVRAVLVEFNLESLSYF
ncbi:MAG: hypothetical protein GYA24_16300 [Candidatus Lokiarchaeota archaeon]|nr:hypothetical protein [Candidatus Lokiarchaeota archaeon]